MVQDRDYRAAFTTDPCGLRIGPRAAATSESQVLRAVAGRLEVEVSNVALIALRGEIDMAGLDDLQSAVEPHLAPGQTVVLDLSGVTFADSTLLKVLQQARGKANDVGGALLVRNPSDQLRQLLTLGDLNDLVQTEVNRQNDLP